MVLVDVIVAERVNKLANFQPADVGHHVHQQRIGADVERHAQESVRRALVKLAVQHAPVFHLKLKQRVAGWQVHFVSLARVPTRHDQSSRVWIPLNLVNEIGDLIHTIALRIITAEGAPEITVNRTEIAGLPVEAPGMFFVGPFGPDVHSLRAQVRFVGVAGKKPEQFFGNPAKGNLLCGYNRKALAQVKSRLITEVRDAFRLRCGRDVPCRLRELISGDRGIVS